MALSMQSVTATKKFERTVPNIVVPLSGLIHHNTSFMYVSGITILALYGPEKTTIVF